MTKIQLRRDTAANWSTNNPTPSAGEPCFETDTGKLKIGDGITAYNSLPYQGGDGLEICDIGMALYVDEEEWLRRYLNGQILDRNKNTEAFFTKLQKITTLHPSLLCTEEEWQSAKTLSAFGQVGKFVFNYSGDEIVSVRLPRVVNVQGLFDLQNLGMTVSAGLPNITGNIGSTFRGLTGVANGAFRLNNDNAADYGVGEGTLMTSKTASLNASRSSSIYGNSNTVQPEAIQYPYFIQIATGSETKNNIINDIELNNPYSLFDSKYSDHELNNLSWLKSEGQWNAKAVYPTAYDKLLKVYNGTETVEGLSVKLSTETYTDYDFVLNTADETFRLPLLDGSEDLVSDKFISQSFTATNNGYIIPITKNGQISIRIYGNTATDVTVAKNGKDVGTFNLQSNTYRQGTITTQVVKGDTIKVFTNVSGTTATCNYSFFENTGNGTLYFYVGETVQNANLIDAGRIGEQVASLIPDNSSLISSYGMPSNKYIELTLGANGSTYTAPANGWFLLQKVAGASGQYCQMWNTTSNFGDFSNSSGIYGQIITCPAKKGEVVRLGYTLSGNTMLFRFIYAEGSTPTV